MSAQSLRGSRDTREMFAPVESLELRRMLAAPWVVNELTLPGGETSYFQPIVVVGDRAYYVNNNGFSGAPPVLDVYRPDLGRWAKSSAAPRALGEGAAADQKAVFLEGGSDVATASVTHAEVYDTQSDTWSDELLPAPLGSGATTLTVGHKAIFAGGFTYSEATGAQPIAAVDIYDAQADQWTTTTLPDPGTYSMSAAAAGDKAVFSGDSLVQVLDTSTNDWSAHVLAGGRADATELAVGHYVILAGGTYVRRGRAYPSDLADVYDANTGGWSVAHLPGHEDFPAATAAGDQGIFAPRTYNRRAGRYGVFAAVFDATTGQWSTTRLPPNTSGLERAVTLDGKALFVKYGQINEYDPSTAKWSQATVNAGLGGFSNVTPVADQILVTERYYDGPYPAMSAEIVGRTGLPGMPGPITPAPRQVIATARPIFSWSPTPDATSYDLYFDDSTSPFGFPVNPTPVTTTATQSTLPERVGGGPHAWHVVAHTPGGDVSSPEFHFSLPDAALRASFAQVQLPASLTPGSVGSATVVLRNAGTAPLQLPGVLTLELRSADGGYAIATVGAANVNGPLAVGASISLTVPLSFRYVGSRGVNDVRLAVSFRRRAQDTDREQVLTTDLAPLTVQPQPPPPPPPPPAPPRHGARTAGGQVG